MTTRMHVVVHPEATSLAAAIAARLITSILDAQAARGHSHIVLTGGTIGTAALAAVRADPAHAAVDWAHVELWWSDERFEPAGSDLRNDTAAQQALLSHLPLNPSLVHPMPARGGTNGDDPTTAAAAYTAELKAAAPPGRDLPAFDVALLGVGPDGHVASLFPGFPTPPAGALVVPVMAAPKSPPVRLSFTLPAINSAAAVWLVADGESKAPALAAALNAAPEALEVPAGMVHGRSQSLALLDVAAALLLRS